MAEPPRRRGSTAISRRTSDVLAIGRSAADKRRTSSANMSLYDAICMARELEKEKKSEKYGALASSSTQQRIPWYIIDPTGHLIRAQRRADAIRKHNLGQGRWELQHDHGLGFSDAFKGGGKAKVDDDRKTRALARATSFKRQRSAAGRAWSWERRHYFQCGMPVRRALSSSCSCDAV